MTSSGPEAIDPEGISSGSDLKRRLVCGSSDLLRKNLNAEWFEILQSYPAWTAFARRMKASICAQDSGKLSALYFFVKFCFEKTGEKNSESGFLR
jgi:hypothetical protein